MRVFDSHVHLDHLDAASLPTAAAAGEYGALVPGIEPRSVAEALGRVRVPGARFAAAIHPWYLAEDDCASPSDDPRWAELVRLAEDPRIAAVGETGLDHYRFREADDRARVGKWFRWHLSLARDVGKPVVVHCVRAHADCERALSPFRGGLVGAVHAFAGSLEEAAAYRRLGFALGIGSAVTNPRSTRVREAAASIPDDQLLVETDAPFLAADGRGRDAGVGDDILRVIEEVAALRGTRPEALAALCSDNAERLFGAALGSG